MRLSEKKFFAIGCWLLVAGFALSQTGSLRRALNESVSINELSVYWARGKNRNCESFSLLFKGHQQDTKEMLYKDNHLERSTLLSLRFGRWEVDLKYVTKRLHRSKR